MHKNRNEWNTGTKIIKKIGKSLTSCYRKTVKSILISCGAKIAPFDIQELRDLMKEDKLEFDTLGDKKTALFVIVSDTDDTFNFVVSIMCSQLFNLLCDKADTSTGEDYLLM